jgi:hypothetical protein
MFQELMPVIAGRPLTTCSPGKRENQGMCHPQSKEGEGRVNDKVGYRKEVAKIRTRLCLCLWGRGVAACLNQSLHAIRLHAMVLFAQHLDILRELHSEEVRDSA